MGHLRTKMEQDMLIRGISERTARQIADRLAATLQIPASEAQDAERFLEALARAHRRTGRYR